MTLLWAGPTTPKAIQSLPPKLCEGGVSPHNGNWFRQNQTQVKISALIHSDLAVCMPPPALSMAVLSYTGLNTALQASLEEVHSWECQGIPAVITEISQGCNMRRSPKWSDKYCSLRCACKPHFHSVAATVSQEQDEDMFHALWNMVEGSWLPEPEDALDHTMRVSHWGTLSCHNLRNVAVIIPLVVCNTWHGLCRILSKMPVQLNSWWIQYFPPPACVKRELVLSALTQPTRTDISHT